MIPRWSKIAVHYSGHDRADLNLDLDDHLEVGQATQAHGSMDC